MDEDILYSVRIIIIGDSNVGKTNIIYRFKTDEFNENILSTIGADFTTKFLKVGQREFKLQLWDTSGQERYHSIARGYYKNSTCAIVVYDITNEKSFESIKKWKDDCQNYNNQNVILILVGNKKDLEQSRKISEEKGREFAEQNGINCFFESSAKTGENIKEIFQYICKIINKRIDDNEIDFDDKSNGIQLLKKNNDNDNDNDNQNSISSCCC